jgi:histidine ammonia-lyase
MAGYAVRLAAVELVCASQAVDLRGGELGRGTAAAYSTVREHVRLTEAGHAPPDNLDPLVRWLESNPVTE